MSTLRLRTPLGKHPLPEGEILTKTLALSVEYAPLIALGVSGRWSEAEEALLFPLNSLDDRVSLRLESSDGTVELSVLGDDDDSRRNLRNRLLGVARLKARPVQHHLLATFSGTTSSHRIVKSIAGWGQFLQDELLLSSRVAKGEELLPDSAVLGYWWDSRANFGDAAGPWLLQAMTGKTIFNARHSDIEGEAIASIGSLFQMLERPNTALWGSGLLYPPTEGQVKRLKKLSGVSVHAVRGPLTRRILQESLGWTVPEVYGDPALLFPRYFKHRVSRKKDTVALVPHKHHRKYFKNVDMSRVSMLHVADDVETVVSSIADSAVCVSTSLHGLIFAQAYGVPWVWLNVEDDDLKGGSFKFEDFFATLDGAQVARVDVSGDQLRRGLDIETIAEHAKLPDLHADLDVLEKAFPLERGVFCDTGVQNFGASENDFSWEEVSGEERLAAVSRVIYRRQQRIRAELAKFIAPGRGFL